MWASRQSRQPEAKPPTCCFWHSHSLLSLRNGCPGAVWGHLIICLESTRRPSSDDEHCGKAMCDPITRADPPAAAKTVTLVPPGLPSCSCGWCAREEVNTAPPCPYVCPPAHSSVNNSGAIVPPPKTLMLMGQISHHTLGHTPGLLPRHQTDLSFDLPGLPQPGGRWVADSGH